MVEGEEVDEDADAAEDAEDEAGDDEEGGVWSRKAGDE